MNMYRLCLLTILLINISKSFCKFQDVNNETRSDHNVTSTEFLLVKQHEVLLSDITLVTTDSSRTANDDKWFQLSTEKFQVKPNGTFNISTERENFEVSGNTKTSPSTDNHKTCVSNQIHTTISNQKYTTGSLPAVLQDKCFLYGSCSFSISDPTWFCRCDSMCIEFKDCCLDFNGSRTDRKTSYKFQCYALGTLTAAYEKGILAVDTCPATYKNTSVIEKCRQNDVAKQGTFVAHNADVIFKNKFCALCNNITDFIMFEIQFYRILLNTEELKNASSLTRQEQIAVIYARSQHKIILPNSIKPRYCLLNVVDNNDSFCQLYINPIVAYNYTRIKIATSHRNYFCVPEEIRNATKCLGDTYLTIRDVNIVGLSVIFSFQYVAPKLQATDYEQCETWTENINNKCQYFETYKDYKVTMVFYLISNRNITESDWLLMALISIWNFEVNNFTSAKGFDFQVDKGGFIAEVTVSIFITKTTFFHEALRIEKEIKEAKIVLSVRDNSTDFEVIVSKSEDIFSNTSFPKKSIRKYPLIVNFFELLLNHNVFIANHIQVFCSDVLIRVTQKMEKIYIDYRTCQATRTLSGYVVSISAILTYVCFSVSAVALIVMIIVNRKYELVTSIAMTNLENMSMSLFLCNVLFMGGIWATHIEKLCYVIGVFLHYLWLTFFSFMVITVQSIVITLTKLKSRSLNISYYERRRRHFLTITGLVIPLIFIAPSVAVDFYGPSYFSPGYSHSVCFPSQFPSNLIFFTVPVVSSIGLNLFSLTRVIIQICKVRLEISSMIKKARSYQDATVYLRIIVLSGIFWIIGIISVLTGSEWLNYIFTLLCGLQGLFLAVANLSTSRTREEQKSSN